MGELGAADAVALDDPTHRPFVGAGLGSPQMSVHAPAGGAPDWPGFDYLADSFRSLLPLLAQYTAARAAEVDVETLAARARTDVVSSRRPFLLTPFVGAWARKPGCSMRVVPAPSPRGRWISPSVAMRAPREIQDGSGRHLRG